MTLRRDLEALQNQDQDVHKKSTLSLDCPEARQVYVGQSVEGPRAALFSKGLDLVRRVTQGQHEALPRDI